MTTAEEVEYDSFQGISDDDLLAIVEHFAEGLDRKMGDVEFQIRDLNDPIADPRIPLHEYAPDGLRALLPAIGDSLISNFSSELVPAFRQTLQETGITERLMQDEAPTVILGTNHEGWEDIGLVLGAVTIALEEETGQDFGGRIDLVTGYAACLPTDLELPGLGKIDAIAVLRNMGNIIKTIPNTNTSTLPGYETVFSQLRAQPKQILRQRIAAGGNVIVVSMSGSDDIKDFANQVSIMKRASPGTEELFFSDEAVARSRYLPVMMLANPFRNGTGDEAVLRVDSSFTTQELAGASERCTAFMQSIAAMAHDRFGYPRIRYATESEDLGSAEQF